MRPEQAGVGPHGSGQGHHDRAESRAANTGSESQAQKKQAHRCERRRERDCACAYEVRKGEFATRRFRIDSRNSQHGPRSQGKRHRQKHQARSLVRVVMSVEVGLVLRVLVVGVDLQGVPLDDGTEQIEARVLIPSAAFIEIKGGGERHQAEQQGRSPIRRRFL